MQQISHEMESIIGSVMEIGGSGNVVCWRDVEKGPFQMRVQYGCVHNKEKRRLQRKFSLSMHIFVLCPLRGDVERRDEV